MSHQLVVLRGPLVGRVFPLGDLAIWFGRTPDAPVPLGSELASRRHAELRKENGVFILSDLGSANGTLVNGERITVRALAPGDIVEIGGDAFRFAPTGPRLPERADQARIVVTRGPLVGREFSLDAPITFGRGLECTVVIQSQRASRYHAQTHIGPTGVILSDHKSGNGTWVNGTRIDAHVLRDGDVIAVGDEEFRVELPPAPGPVGLPGPPVVPNQPPGPALPPLPPGMPTFSVRCPSCARVVDARFQDCPWDGASLANGRTAFLAVDRGDLPPVSFCGQEPHHDSRQAPRDGSSRRPRRSEWVRRQRGRGDRPDSPSPSPPPATPAPEAPKAEELKSEPPKRDIKLPQGAGMKGSQVTIPGNIVYDTGKSTIKPESEPTLNQLKEFLEGNPQVNLVRIEGHTDTDGDNNANMKLSGERVLSCVKWLVSKGIVRERLLATGHGEMKPLVPNDSPANKEQNRRTEFHVAILDGVAYLGRAPDGGGTVFK